MEEHEDIRGNVNVRNRNLINRAVHVHDIGRRKRCKSNNNYGRDTKSNRRCLKREKNQVSAQKLNDSLSVNSFEEFLNKNAFEDASDGNKKSDEFLSDDMFKQFLDTDERKSEEKNQHYANFVINNLKKRLISDSKTNISSKRHGIKNFIQHCTCNEKVNIKNIQSEKYINEQIQKNIRLKSTINRLVQIPRKETEKEDLKKWNDRYKNKTDILNVAQRPILIKLEKPKKHIINNLAKGDYSCGGRKTCENSINDWLSNSLIVYSEESDIESTHHDNLPKRVDVFEVGEYHRLSSSTTRIFFKRDVNSVSSTIIVCSEKKLVAPKNLLKNNNKLSKSGCTVDIKTTFKHEQRSYESKFENDEQENNSRKYLRPNHQRLASEKEMDLCSAELKKEISPKAVLTTSHTRKQNFDAFTITDSVLKLEKKCSQKAEMKYREKSIAKLETKLDILIESVHTFIEEVKRGRLSVKENESLLKSEIGSYNCKNITVNSDIDLNKTKQIFPRAKLNIDSMNDDAESFEQNYAFCSEQDFKKRCDYNKEFAQRTFYRKGDDQITKEFVIADYKTNVRLKSNDKIVEDIKNATDSISKNDEENNTNSDSVKDVLMEQFKNKAVNTHALSCYALLYIFLQTLWILMKEFSSIFYNSSFSRLSLHKHNIKYSCDLCHDIFPTACELRRHIELHTVERLRNNGQSDITKASLNVLYQYLSKLPYLQPAPCIGARADTTIVIYAACASDNGGVNIDTAP
ncbi:hypothetical protein EVAR_81739_1 [Eumeta japonica]|uniref:C2H2-type domain-containing protein n=1 Tax=Eumeta variegata TaxID=151549 RepID=A0A4C1UHG6_EUMVA|nr:hypothetical protein EVAR_81739_1 [Eumeta japonica]